VPVGAVSTIALKPSDPVPIMTEVQTNHMTYTVTCPALSETETVTDLDRAMDICFAMHDESDSYAYIRDAFGDIVGEYGDVMEAVADQLI